LSRASPNGSSSPRSLTSAAGQLYYARIFEGYALAKRTSAEQAIRAARQSEGRAMDAIRGEVDSWS
jgi:hypothetical protein